jgi:hypothetical protein
LSKSQPWTKTIPSLETLRQVVCFTSSSLDSIHAANKVENPDIKTRDKAFEMLQSYLSQKTDLDSLELMKMWKGLFFSMWHCDKSRNQQQLAQDFGKLLHVLPKETLVPFLDAFWNTMARQWIGIDALRYVALLS